MILFYPEGIISYAGCGREREGQQGADVRLPPLPARAALAVGWSWSALACRGCGGRMGRWEQGAAGRSLPSIKRYSLADRAA